MEVLTVKMILGRLFGSLIIFGISFLIFRWRRIKLGDPFFTNTYLQGIFPLPSAAGYSVAGMICGGIGILLNLAMLIGSWFGVPLN
ncbi:MAG: hypothetical protein KKF46_00475 [Nanoarchaeota archaeon]|nr:hypothetical protein [Nanoarchaeota archaeon]MBU1320809.1 hypothetical protein [Nanoarchaeota archaeon]MBU1596818.1 hypothetical protein [Nanoarchaeota archaeon]MBU2440887.1 hypothetical protein [Nanoarchaeota archaeon]